MMKKYKFYYTKIGTLYRKLCGQLVSFIELFIDKRNTGTFLHGTIKSPDGKRATSEPIRYGGLKAVFDGAEFGDDDSFLDIGCGKGRALAYMNSIGFKGKITGVEYNPVVAKAAKEWTKSYDNITVIEGDAFDLDFNDYNIMFMFNPFYDEEIQRLIAQIEDTVNHRVTMYYYGDSVCGKYFAHRECWTKIRRGIFFKKGPICVQYYPTRYTIWEYNPK